MSENHENPSAETITEAAPQEEMQTEQEREPSHHETAMLIADRLGEPGEQQRKQLFFLVRALGRTQSRALLEETLHIEESGGMMLSDGSRRRTPWRRLFPSRLHQRGSQRRERALEAPTQACRKRGSSAYESVEISRADETVQRARSRVQLGRPDSGY